jgi:hypothetical protein
MVKYEELPRLLDNALQSGIGARLEHYLTSHSGLPGPRMNLALANAFAGQIAALVCTDQPPVEAVESLLDGWAAMNTHEANTSDPRVILPCSAVLSYGYVGAARPDWWDDEIAKLHRAASDSRWRVREMVAAALQQMLAADWSRTLIRLYRWLADSPTPLIARAAAAAVAEPALLTDVDRGTDAVAIQEAAVTLLEELSSETRRSEDGRTLRKALGFTISVSTAAAPEAGFALLRRFAASTDPDLHWIVRENVKKSRLKHWPDQLAALSALLA